MNTPIANARLFGGKKSPIRDWPAGAQVASPKPTPKRAMNICV